MALCFCLLFSATAYALNLDKVKVAFLKGDYKAAIKEGEKTLAESQENSPGLDELYYMLGLSYLKDGNALRASDIFEIIINEFKQSLFEDDAILGLGDTYFVRAEYSRARDFYKRVLDRGKTSKLSATALHRLSLCALKEGNTEEAQRYLNRLKEKFPLFQDFKADDFISNAPCQIYYTIQVGSFSKRLNADNLAKRLKEKGFDSYSEEGIGQGGKGIFRVRVGKFSSRVEAEELSKKLSSAGYPVKIFP